MDGKKNTTAVVLFLTQILKYYQLKLSLVLEFDFFTYTNSCINNNINAICIAINVCSFRSAKCYTVGIYTHELSNSSALFTITNSGHVNHLKPITCTYAFYDNSCNHTDLLFAANFTCPGNGFYVNPSNCHQYFQCNGGTAFLHTCNGNLFYDSTCTCCNNSCK